MSIDRSKHKGNIANLHEQCQSQLDEHLTAKQESFQKQIDRMKEQYQQKLEDEHKKLLDANTDLFQLKAQKSHLEKKSELYSASEAVHAKQIEIIKSNNWKKSQKLQSENEQAMAAQREDYEAMISHLKIRIDELEGDNVADEK